MLLIILKDRTDNNNQILFDIEYIVLNRNNQKSQNDRTTIKFPSSIETKDIFELIRNYSSTVRSYIDSSPLESLMVSNSEQTTSISEEDFQNAERNMKSSWELMDTCFRQLVRFHNSEDNYNADSLVDEICDEIRDSIRNDGNNEFLLLIQTSNIWLQKAPWDEILKSRIIKYERKYSHKLSNKHVELSVGLLYDIKDQSLSVQEITNSDNRGETKVLVIIGNNNIQSDYINSEICKLKNRLLQSYPEQISIQHIIPGNREELIDAIEQYDYNILAFISHGDLSLEENHSSNGSLYLVPGIGVTIENLRASLRKKTNSKQHLLILIHACDSLGVAKDLISQVRNISCVAMKEPIHVVVALKFLEKFLNNLLKHKKLHLAILKTKEHRFSVEGDDSLYSSKQPVLYLPCNPYIPISDINTFSSEVQTKPKLRTRGNTYYMGLIGYLIGLFIIPILQRFNLFITLFILLFFLVFSISIKDKVLNYYPQSRLFLDINHFFLICFVFSSIFRMFPVFQERIISFILGIILMILFIIYSYLFGNKN